MSARWRIATSTERALHPMTTRLLDEVMLIESAAYPFPWTRGNFVDALAAGHTARVLKIGDTLAGYFVLMAGVDEMHLLNITVAPAQQRRGHALHLLGAIVTLSRQQRAEKLWLEVRGSNERARAIYLRYGFTDIGVRKGYYPAPEGQREDAIVMALNLTEHADAME